MEVMSTVIIRMRFQAFLIVMIKMKEGMVYMFDPLQIECLMPIDHKYLVLMLLNLDH
jgi:hypothetical protein